MKEKYDALTLEHEGKECVKKLLEVLLGSDIFENCYAKKIRVKSEEKLLKKLEIKRKTKEYDLLKVTDVVGIRFILLFKKEMPTIFKNILKTINHDISITPNPFIKRLIEEVVVYRTHIYDEIPEEIRAVLATSNPGVVCNVADSKEGYSSIHIITRLNHDLKTKLELQSSFFMPLEIQIRTVFEDAWGEIDHKYGYVNRAGKETGVPISNIQTVSRHLKIFKKFTDACADYANAIYTEACPDQTPTDTAQDVVSVGADDELIIKMQQRGVSPTDINSYCEARESRMAAENGEEKHTDGWRTLFLQAAEKFKDLGDNSEPKALESSSSPYFLFFYYSKMNEAFCLLSTKAKEYVQNASAIYSSLEERYSDFPILKMRKAQACGHLGKTRDSINKYDEAYEMLSSFEEDGCIFNDFIPRIDYGHLCGHLPRLFGYQLWKQSTLICGAEPAKLIEKKVLLEKAYELTLQTMETADIKRRLSTINNLLYYAIELSEVDTPIAGTSSVSLCTIIRSHLSQLEIMGGHADSSDIDVLDTFARAYYAISEFEDALGIIDRTHKLCFTEHARRMYHPEYCYEILFGMDKLKERVMAAVQERGAAVVAPGRPVAGGHI